MHLQHPQQGGTTPVQAELCLVTGRNASTDGPQSDPPCRPAGSSPRQPPTRTHRPGASPQRCLPPGSLPAQHSTAMPASHSPTRALSLPPGRRAGRPQRPRRPHCSRTPLPPVLPQRLPGAAPCGGLRSEPRLPPRCRPRGPAADSRPGFRPRFPSSGPGRLSPQRPAALPHCGEPPPPHLPRRPRSPTWPLAAAPRLPSAHRSLLPPRHGPAAEPSPGEAPLLPPVPTPPRLPAGGAAAARPRRRQGAARPHPAAGPAAAERGALRLGEGERSAITDRFPKTADCRVTVTVPHCFICLWRGLFLNLCPSEAPIPLIS